MNLNLEQYRFKQNLKSDSFTSFVKFQNEFKLVFYFVVSFHILSVKTNYEEFSNLKRIEKKIEKSSIKQMIGLDREDMKSIMPIFSQENTEMIVCMEKSCFEMEW